MVDKNLSAWLTYIENCHRLAIDLSLERIIRIPAFQQLAVFQCPVLTIAGTNGKGSCVRFLEQILLTAGYKVGAYTSPHFLHFNERIRINGQVLSDEALCAAFLEIDGLRKGNPLSFFEFSTLAALYLFQQAKLDCVLLEVGLGGRLDAVNIVDPDIAVITSIAIDHQEYLGHTREEIGREKAGIMRRGCPVVCGDPEPPNSVLQRAKELGADLYCVGSNFNYIPGANKSVRRLYLPSPQPSPVPTIRTLNKIGKAGEGFVSTEFLKTKSPLPPFDIIKGSKVGARDGWGEGITPHLGWSWQSPNARFEDLPALHLPIQNAATSLMVVELLQKHFTLSKVAIYAGLASASLPGRFQVTTDSASSVTTIFDVAHNPASAALLAQQLSAFPRPQGKQIAVVGMLSDKDILQTLKPLAKWMDSWYIGSLDMPRGAKALVLAEALEVHAVQAYRCFNSVEEAYLQALANADKQDTIIVFGSFHTVAAAMKHLNSLP